MIGRMEMQIKLWRLRGNDLLDITPLVGEVSWRSNKDELGTELNFVTAFGDAIHNPKKHVNLGDLIILKDGSNEITRCIVIDEEIKGREPIPYKAFDLSFYLNKSKRVYQFNGVSATQAINRICVDAKIPVYGIANMPTKIDKIYLNETLSDIIKDILDQVEKDRGSKYIFDMKQGKINVFQSKDMIIEPKFKIPVLWEHSINDAIMSASRKRSIDNMKNSIQVTSDGKLLTTASDNTLINQYGLLSEIVDVQEEDRSKARNIAKNTLKELGKVFEDNQIETLGDSSVLAGRLIKITEPLTKMNGYYMIESVQHTVKNGIHRMSLSLSMKGVS